MRKFFIISLFSTIILLSLPLLSGFIVKNIVLRIAAMITNQAHYQLYNEEYQWGWLHSALNLRYKDGANVIEWQIKMSHGPLLLDVSDLKKTSLGFTQLVSQIKIAANNNTAVINNYLHIGLTGKILSELSIPEFHLENQKTNFKLRSQQFNWQLAGDLSLQTINSSLQSAKISFTFANKKIAWNNLVLQFKKTTLNNIALINNSINVEQFSFQNQSYRNIFIQLKLAKLDQIAFKNLSYTLIKNITSSNRNIVDAHLIDQLLKLTSRGAQFKLQRCEADSQSGKLNMQMSLQFPENKLLREQQFTSTLAQQIELLNLNHFVKISLQGKIPPSLLKQISESISNPLLASYVDPVMRNIQNSTLPLHLHYEKGTWTLNGSSN